MNSLEDEDIVLGEESVEPATSRSRSGGDTNDQGQPGNDTG